MEDDWMGNQGMLGITEIVQQSLDKMAVEELEDTKADIVAILESIKEERPDLVLKYMKYLKKSE